MNNIVIDKKNQVFLICDTKGTQPKFKENNFWYKTDLVGIEGTAEHLSSLVLDYSTLPKDITYVHYDMCKINDKNGCRSANFLCEGEEYVSFKILYKNLYGGELSEKIFSLEEDKRFDFIVDLIKECTSLDISSYLSTCISFDNLILNPDRHFGNLGMIKRSDNTYKLAPIFDNGQGLGANYHITPPDEDYENKKKELYGATLCGSFDNAMQLAGGNSIKIDYERLYNHLCLEPESIAKRFLIVRLNELDKIYNISNKNPFHDIVLNFYEEDEEYQY